MTYPTDYDDLIRKAWADHFPDVPELDWLYGKAQLCQESGLKPHAISKAGAEGIAQFMPETWEDVCNELDMVGADVFEPKYAIPGFAFYMRSLWDMWTAPRPFLDRYNLTLGAYNAGIGSMIRAQRLARTGGKIVNDWVSIAQALPGITGVSNAMQTTGYVARIHAIYKELGGE